MADPKFYEQAPDKVSAQIKQFQDLEKELEVAYGRWESLIR